MKPCYLTYDVGGTRIKSGIITAGGEILRRRIDPTRGEDGAKVLLRRMQEFGAQLLEETDDGHQLQAVGISFTGVVDPVKGQVVLLNGKIPDIEGVEVAPIMGEHFNVPAWADNDGRIYTLGEWKYGAGRGYENVVCVTVGTGIGSGVIRDGKIIRSSGLLAGILGGHITINPSGPLCGCGNRGCFENYASTTALVNEMRLHLERGCPSIVNKQVRGDLSRLEGRHILAGVSKGDELCRFVFDRWIDILGAGLVTLVHTYDPDVLIVGGGVANAKDLILPPVEKYVQRHSWTWPKGRVKVCASELGDDAALWGCAALVENELRAGV